MHITLTAYDFYGTKLSSGGAKLNVYLTSPHMMTIISQALIMDNADGTYTCDYRSPKNKGYYYLYIEVDGITACSSPCPIFFNSERSLENKISLETDKKPLSSNHTYPHEENADLCERTKQAVQAINNHLQGTLGLKPTIVKLQLGMQAALQQAQATSTVIKVHNLFPILSLREIHKLFSVCGHLKSVEFRKEMINYYILIQYQNVDQANSSLVLSGMQIGGRILRVEKWLNQFVRHNEGETIQLNDKNKQIWLSKTPNNKMNNIELESTKIDPIQWKKEWDAKQIQHRIMLERYAALVAASKFKDIKPCTLLVKNDNIKWQLNLVVVSHLVQVSVVVLLIEICTLR
jgi:hypothetical protein